MSTPTMTVHVLVSPEHGEMLPVEGMSLLLGVSAEQIRVRKAFNGTMGLPPEWLKSGRRRSKEAQAHGHTDTVGAMTYWAKKDPGADLVIEYGDWNDGAQ